MTKPDPAQLVPEFVVLDLETTGLDPESDRIIEVAAIRYDRGREVETVSHLVHPGIKIPPAVTNLTGISDLDLDGCPTLEKILPSLLLLIYRS